MKRKVLIICPSWEDRSWLGFEQDFKCSDFNYVIIVKKEHSINPHEVDEQNAKIARYCNDNHINNVEILWKDNPIENWNTLQKVSNDIFLGTEVMVDITTMPRDVIWTILFFATQMSNETINIKYYQPATYNSTWLSKEPLSPRFLLKHSGLMEIGKPTCTVIITGFDTERTQQIVTKFEPQKVVLLIQTGDQFDNEKRNAGNIQKGALKEMGKIDVTCHSIDFYNDDFGGNSIIEILNKLEDYNIILASIGPKTSAIGAYIAYMHYPAVALCYVPCSKYNVDYCKGIGKGLDYTFTRGANK